MKIRRFLTNRLAIAALAAVAVVSIALPGATGLLQNSSVEADASGAIVSYIRFEGLEGGAQDVGYQKWSEILSFNQAINRSDSGAGSTLLSGEVVVEAFVAAKEIDASTPKLQEAVLTGRTFPTVEIHITASYGSQGRLTFYAYELTDVQIVGYVVGNTEDGGVPVEEFYLKPKQIKVTYTEIGLDGSPKGSVEYSWNSKEGTAK